MAYQSSPQWRLLRRPASWTRAPGPRSVHPTRCWCPVFMAHTLIARDATLAVALAAWWQLRRSAHLLPHLRRGPSSFSVNPVHGFGSWIMAITVRPLLTIHCVQRPTRRVVPGTRNPQEPSPRGLGPATTPIPIPAELRPPSGSEPPTCPFPVVRDARMSIASQGRPPVENGAAQLEPPTQPSIGRRGAA